MSVSFNHLIRRDSPAERGNATRFLTAGALLIILPIAFLMEPVLLEDRLPLCPFRCIIGEPCPFCGLTRALAEATHGRWRTATGLNPLWPLALAVIVTFAILNLVDAFFAKRSSANFAGVLLARANWIIGALILFEIWRLYQIRT